MANLERQYSYSSGHLDEVFGKEGGNVANRDDLPFVHMALSNFQKEKVFGLSGGRSEDF